MKRILPFPHRPLPMTKVWNDDEDMTMSRIYPISDGEKEANKARNEIARKRMEAIANFNREKPDRPWMRRASPISKRRATK